jgi:Protein of unknown function (DUF1003)
MSTRATASPGTLSSRPPSGYAALLAAEGLGCWSKTTHGKSLHVMVPIAPEMDWDRALACTRIVTECLAEIDPDRYVTSAGLEARPGPLFIDYTRNGRGTNAVGDLSPRATGFSGRRSLQLAKDGRRASVGRVQPSKPALLEDFVGTISFVMAQLVAFAAWIVVNVGKVPQLAPFDPFPYRLLSSITSLEAVLLAARRDHLDLQVNLLTEQRATQIIQMLNRLSTRLGIDQHQDEVSRELGRHVAVEHLRRIAQPAA